VPSGGTAASPSLDSAAEVLTSLRHFKSFTSELADVRGPIHKERGQIDLFVLRSMDDAMVAVEAKVALERRCSAPG